ncbi:MAG TPA: hypothetical protein PLL72_12965 [Burkholderiaceae bacterium]|nr:hypothetical protein [Burkholderiaceae bacterium]
MRPRGSYGGVARALLCAAEAGPGSARELAARALVGKGAAAWSCSRLVARGELVVLDPGERPATLARPADLVEQPETVAAALDRLERAFWERMA